MKIHNHEQRTPEWFACRAGKLTGSNALVIANKGAGLKTYCHKVLAEKYAHTQEESYKSTSMVNGVDLEPHARSLFEFKTEKKVTEVGFIEYSEYIGASPDGLIEAEKAIVEIKCHENKNHFMLMVYGEDQIEKCYLYQMQMEMLCAGYEKGYYVAYNPNFDESLLVFEIKKDESIQAEILEGCKKGIEIMTEIENTLIHKK